MMLEWINPFEMPGRWLKGNVHTHTTRSDSPVSVEERIDAYHEAGYDFIVLTDHFVASNDADRSTDDFLVIDGVECHANGREQGEFYHVVGINTPPGFEVAEPMTIGEIRRALVKAGAMLVLAHPYWSGNTVPRVLEVLEGVTAIEVFNATCLGIGKGTARVHWDDILDWGVRVHGLAVDDCHGAEDDAFKAWVMVRAPKLDLASVMDALHAGAYYSTTGPRIEEVTVDGGRLRVRCSPATSITFIAQRNHGRRIVADRGKRLHEAHYTLSGEESYLRIEVWDSSGGTAWTNPIYFDQKAKT